MIAQAIRTYLLTKSTVTDEVSTRIRPDALVQDETLPALVIQETSSDHEELLNGAGGISHSSITIACYAATRIKADQVAEIIRQVLHGYTGSAGSQTIQASQLEDRAVGYLVPNDGSDVGLYVNSLDFRITFTETIPTF